MFDCSNLTVNEYIRTVDCWYQENKKRPINSWNVFQPALRWAWEEDWRDKAIREYDKMLRDSGVEVGWL